MYRGQMFILKGIIGIIFGIIAVAIPGFTLGTLFTIFGLFIIAAGIIAFLFAVTSHPKDSSLWFWLSLGILALGLLSVLFPEMIALSFAIIIAGWALITGIFDLEHCITGRRYFYYLFGGMSGTFIALLVALLYFVPALRADYLMTTFGVFVFVFGIFSLVIGMMIIKGKMQDAIRVPSGQE
ncbi:MAG: DUF308 domain-containing protein [Methanoregula sp.]|nr:MAG: DUF308 domain-containing protein [Methanoregula sp.]